MDRLLILPEYDREVNMSCVFKASFAAVYFALCCGCGAEQSADVVVSAKFKNEVQMIKDSLTIEGARYPYNEVVARMTDLIAGASNQVYRAQAACSYAEMLKEVDLVSLPYRRRETAVIMFGGHVFFAFRFMIKNGVEPKEAMTLFFDCLEKYRSACMSVSDSEKAANESRDDYMARRDCARVLKDDCKQRLSVIRRFWLPRLSDYLPVEHHDEFRKRFEAFMAK